MFLTVTVKFFWFLNLLSYNKSLLCLSVQLSQTLTFVLDIYIISLYSGLFVVLFNHDSLYYILFILYKFFDFLQVRLSFWYFVFCTGYFRDLVAVTVHTVCYMYWVHCIFVYYSNLSTSISEFRQNLFFLMQSLYISKTFMRHFIRRTVTCPQSNGQGTGIMQRNNAEKYKRYPSWVAPFLNMLSPIQYEQYLQFKKGSNQYSNRMYSNLSLSKSGSILQYVHVASERLLIQFHLKTQIFIEIMSEKKSNMNFC